MDDRPNVATNIDIRYVLNIPFQNVNEGISVMVIMMNPSKADLQESDPTVDKLINFFFNKIIRGRAVKEIRVCNVFPVYASNTKDAFIKIRQLHNTGILERLQNYNEKKIDMVLEEADLLVLGWGKPTEGNIPYLYYYKEVYKILSLIFNSEIDTYVFEVGDANSLLTKSGDPRHPAGTLDKALINIVHVTKQQLLGF